MRIRVLSALVFMTLWMAVSDAQQTTRQIIITLRAGQSITKVTRDSATHVVRQIPGQSIYLLEVDSGTVTTALEKLIQSPAVVVAESNRAIPLESGSNPATPSDAKVVQSMAALLDGQTITNFYGTDVLKAYVDQTALQIIGAPDTRNISTGTGTRIAFIDTGVDADHPVLRPWLDPGIDLVGNGSISEFDGVSLDLGAWVRGNAASAVDSRLSFLLKQSMAALLDDGSGETTPPGFPPAFGHGTLVAGVLHAVAPLARLVPIRAFDPYGNTTLFKLAEGIYRGADLGVDVLNMSFSSTEVSKTLQQAIIYAHGKGIALVASVGNESRDAGSVYPAAYPLVCAVAATDFNDRLAPFSNYGSIVSISAPGAYVISTAPGGRYAMAWGTSFSAPIVSAAIALVASLGAHSRGSQSTSFVTTGAVPIDDKNPEHVRELGGGRVYLPNVFLSVR